MESLAQENDKLKQKQSYMDDIEEEYHTLEQKIDVRVRMCMCVDPSSGFSLVYRTVGNFRWCIFSYNFKFSVRIKFRSFSF